MYTLTTVVGIYFGRRDGQIKIGCSQNIGKRVISLKLELIGAIQCQRKFMYHFEHAALCRTAPYRYYELYSGTGAEWCEDRPEVIQVLREGLPGLVPYLGRLPSYKLSPVLAYARSGRHKPLLVENGISRSDLQDALRMSAIWREVAAEMSTL